MRSFFLLPPLATLLMCSTLSAQTPGGMVDQGTDMSPPVLSLSYSPGSLGKGSFLKVRIQLDKGWHINSNHPVEEFLLPSKVSVSAKGIQFDSALYPEPHKEYVEALQLENLVFLDTFTVQVPILSVEPGYDSLTTSALLEYQACSNSICLSPSKASASLSGSPATPSSTPQTSATGVPWRLLLLAFLGGLILNLMPCVLPVLPLKALGLVRQAHESRARLWSLSLATVAGVLVSFLALAMLVIGLRGAGEAVGWGFQFQNPAFLFALSLLMTVFALNLFGVFEITLPGSAARGAAQASSGEGLGHAFAHGLLLTLLSTPCSAPFLGSAMGFAFTQGDGILVLFFLVAALGLSLPYLLLPLFPNMLRKLPKPGTWMVRLKQFLGFLLIGTVLFLAYVFGASSGNEAVGMLLGSLLITSIVLWMLGLWGGATAPAWRGWGLWMLFILIAWLSWTQLVRPAIQEHRQAEAQVRVLEGPDAEGWYAWSPDAMTRWQDSGKTVFLDFTAEWCITCKANEKAVLKREIIKEKMLELDIIPAKADWTEKSPAVSQELARFGRAGVPFYVVYPGDHSQNPIILSELLTVESVLQAMEQAGPSVRP